jgi:hypothetical protein
MDSGIRLAIARGSRVHMTQTFGGPHGGRNVVGKFLRRQPGKAEAGARQNGEECRFPRKANSLDISMLKVTKYAHGYTLRGSEFVRPSYW